MADLPRSPSVVVPEPLPDVAGGPLAIVGRWIDDAGAAGIPVPSTMTFATSGPDGPRARTVLVTAWDAATLRFHSSTPSGKTLDLAADPRASAVFHWPVLGRQAVLAGRAEELPAAVSDAAFPERPRQLQLVAWAYDALTPGLTGPGHGTSLEDIGGAVRAAAADPGSSRRPPSWTTIAFTPERVDLWRAGDEHTVPARTRFLRDGVGWRSFPVLP